MLFEENRHDPSPAGLCDQFSRSSFSHYHNSSYNVMCFVHIHSFNITSLFKNHDHLRALRKNSMSLDGLWICLIFTCCRRQKKNAKKI